MTRERENVVQLRDFGDVIQWHEKCVHRTVVIKRDRSTIPMKWERSTMGRKWECSIAAQNVGTLRSGKTVGK